MANQKSDYAGSGNKADAYAIKRRFSFSMGVTLIPEGMEQNHVNGPRVL